MTLRVTNLDVWNAVLVVEPGKPAPLEIAAEWPLPAVMALVVRQWCRVVPPIFGDIHAVRAKLWAKYGELDEQGAPRIVDGRVILRDPEGFAQEWAALLAQPVELPGCRALTLDEIAPHVVVAASVMDRLEHFVRI